MRKKDFREEDQGKKGIHVNEKKKTAFGW